MMIIFSSLFEYFMDDFIYEECCGSRKSSSFDDDEDDLEFMTADERREYCEDNGIDIDDCDFD